MALNTSRIDVNSQTASALHARLQIGTRRARQAAAPDVLPTARRPPRVTEGAIWKLLDHLHVSKAATEPTLSSDVALRRVLVALLEGTTHTDRPVALTPSYGPILIVRSGPWPLLRALLAELAQCQDAPAVTVLCHRRDSAMLEQLSQSTQLPLRPLYYPRFEPFNPTTLQRVIAADQTKWAATFLLDASRSGTSRSLDHLTRALAPLSGAKYVWTAAGNLFQPLSLFETLGRERYEIVRRLLRWRAVEGDEPATPSGRNHAHLRAMASSAS